MILYHLPILTDNNCTSRGEDLIIWVTVELLCCILKTNIRLYINDTSIKKRNRCLSLPSDQLKHSPVGCLGISVLTSSPRDLMSSQVWEPLLGEDPL